VTSLVDLPKLIQPRANKSKSRQGGQKIHLDTFHLLRLRLFGGLPKSSSLNILNKMGGLKMGDFSSHGIESANQITPKTNPKDIWLMVQKSG